MKKLNIVLEKKKLDAIKADATVVFVIEKNLKHKFNDEKALKAAGFEGEGTFFCQASNTLYIGLKELNHDALREGGFKATSYFKNLPFGSKNFKSIKIASYGCSVGMEAVSIGLFLGLYEFDKYKSQKKQKHLEKVIISNESYADPIEDFTQDHIDRAKIIAQSVCDVRDVVNTPPQDATPIFLAKWAQDVAKENKLTCKILDEKDIAKEKMECILAVARASVHKPRVIHLTYKPKKPKARIVVVGKGLTYDCGGLSLKSSDYMTTMKADKSGGCAVIGAMEAIAKLCPDVEVHGIVGAVENMIGGDAYKPDDVLKSREGVTIEVQNTDAEGRLVLADCLSYAQDLKPDYLLDFATLTGACVVALGEYTSGVMGHCDCVKEKYRQAALESGELATSLHFNDHLDKLLKSEIADVSNISGSRYGGAITAGLFLSRFIRKEYKNKWVHVDIAGPAFVEKQWDVNTFGASGIGVRSIVNFALELSK
ncbi:MAG: leucyl aminopeptidase [Helicobacter sp.]|nr:leucyl aminopeptidase [Helicobacter sp.]